MSTNTQFHLQTAGAAPCDVVIGFDFGTSCTKIVIRTPYQHGGVGFAVPFGAMAHPSNPHFLPSVLWSAPDKGLSLSFIERGHLYRDIKYRLMSRQLVTPVDGEGELRPIDCQEAAVVFIAATLRHARSWFLREKEVLYGSHQLRWSFNLGLPSANFDDNDLRDDYQWIAHAAWRLSVSTQPISLEAARRQLTGKLDWEALATEDDAEIKLIPEVAAEVAGYARSTARREGLHLLVDIGATTLDICGFILRNLEGDDCYHLLTADVARLGTLVLHEQRMEIAQSWTGSGVSPCRSWNPIDPLPDLGGYGASDEARLRRLAEVDRNYIVQSMGRVWRSIVDLRAKRDPNSSVWQSTLPVFVAGGGSHVGIYRSALDEASKWMQRHYRGSRGLSLRSLSHPKGLQSQCRSEDFHRLAVAWGLSYPETDIGQVTPPSDAPDIVPREARDVEVLHPES